MNNFQAVLREAYRLLRPGGILLVHEIQLHAYSAWEGYTPKALVPATFEVRREVLSSQADRVVAHPSQGGLCVSRRIVCCPPCETLLTIDSLDNFHNIDNMLLGAGFEKDKVDAFVHYRQPLPDDPDTGKSHYSKQDSD